LFVSVPAAIGLVHAQRSPPGQESPPEIPWLNWLPSSPAANRVTSTVLGIVGRNWRSPGSRVVGIRVVEVETGGPVSVQSAAVKVGTSIALSEFVRSMNRPAFQRNLERMRALQSEMKELQRTHSDDFAAAQRELMHRHPEARLNWLGCAAPLASTTV